MSKIDHGNNSEDKIEKARQAFAMLVCYEDMSPLSCCHPLGSFRQMMETLNPYMVPYLDFKSLKQNCLKIYQEEHAKVKEIFSNLGGHISLSVDLSVDEKRWNKHICLSAHFIDDDWKLQKWVIKYCDDQKFVYPGEATLKSMKEWDIEGKILCLTDDGTTDTAALVKQKVQEKKKLPLNGQLLHVRCCSDVISRMVQKGFKMIDPIIRKVELLSWSKSLPLWYLTSYKLRSALELEAMGEFSDAQGYDVPTEEEWGKVRSVCKIADRIYEIIQGLFKVKTPTVNLFLPHLQEIMAYLRQEAASSDPFVNSVAQKMLKKFNKYWEEVYLVLSIAAFMDPRYKLKLLEFSSSKLGDDKKDVHILETLRELYDGYTIQSDPMEYLLSESSSESDEEDEGEGFDIHIHEIKQSHTIKDKLNILREYAATSMTNQQRKSDLDLYLEDPVLPWIENFGVLHWWKDNCMKYPQLSRMARDYLAIPMSLATSYEAYNTEPREADRTLVSVSPQLMNALKCTRSWKLGSRNSTKD